MTDGLGSKSYIYNDLSQLKSETRTFNGVGTFTLSYDYNLGGELKKLTDSTGMTINYDYDNTGRLNGVTGSDNLYANVSNYASNFEYRAWGGLKAMTDGLNHVTSLLYNSKLQPSQYDISGNVVHQNYDYNDDGRVRFVHNTTDIGFDRSYSYDHAARLTEARSGGAARGDNVSTPYNETFGYDPFSNLTSRWSLSWNGQTNDSDSATYANNRRSGWGYDADGRNTSIDTRTYNFDAVGQMKSMTAQQVLSNGNHITVTENVGYDGDGVKVYDVASGATNYYLRSSVLRGAIIEEITSSGQKNIGYVYSPSGTELAQQSTNIVIWKQNSPAGTSQYIASSNGTGRTEFDPLGADISLTAPPDPPPSEGEGDIGGGHFGGIMDARWSDFFNLDGGCVLDGVATSCGLAMSALNSGAASEAMRASYYNLTTHKFDYVGYVYADPVFGFAMVDFMGHGAMAETGKNGHLPDSSIVNAAGTNDSSVTIIAGADFVSTITGLGSPQNTAQSAGAAAGSSAIGAARLLRNNDCSNFISELISISASVAGQPWSGRITPSFGPLLDQNGNMTPSYNAYYALNEYERALAGGRVTASGQSGRSGDTTTYGTTTNNSTISWNREFYSLGQTDRALMVLHESLHLIANFSDFAVAGAAHIMATRGTNNPGNTGNFRNQTEASEYINQQIAAHCRH